jgi:hypothetical protein
MSVQWSQPIPVAQPEFPNQCTCIMAPQCTGIIAGEDLLCASCSTKQDLHMSRYSEAIALPNDWTMDVLTDAARQRLIDYARPARSVTAGNRGQVAESNRGSGEPSGRRE